jgi:hypothetical protein
MRTFGLLIIVLLFICSPRAFGAIIEEQGVGQASYTQQSTKDARREAVQKAKINALHKYSSKFDISKSTIYDRIRPVIEADIDSFLTDYLIIEDVQDKDYKYFRVIIEANIDATAIEKELAKVSSINSELSQKKANITFVFVAREAKAVTKYLARETMQVLGESSIKGVRSARTASARLTVGGSNLQKADEIIWNVSTVNEIDTAMNNIFTTSGYEVVDVVYVYDASKGKLDSSKFIKDYKSGDDISPETRRSAMEGCRTAELDYLATGTLDIGMNDNVADGIERVYVSVTGKIWSVNTKYPKIVASVGPIQSAGLGPDQRVAKLNALKNAGEMVARELISQLRMKGIQ